mmetsp:Transcript_4529/g.13039  ORF Transcript_4529/g.13039 Transcript_4529/m.13039 type:complete len:303 (-) Transcript_4529:493-1401(-)
MGASGSVLMATMTLESFIPLRCCMAPEIPAAMYRSGATTFPVCPTCQSLGQNPASTAAREAPTAAPSLSASASRMGKLSPLLIPLPPLTTMLALDRSGRSDFETDSPIHSALSKCSTTPSRVSTSTDEASTRSALSKQVGRTDRTLRLDPPGPGLATTLPSTLPAYIGRIKVCSSSISKTSVTGDTSSSAAARGTTVLPNLDWVPTTKTHSSSLSLSPSTTALTALATVSLSLSSMGTCRTLETPSGTLFGGLAPTTRRRMALLWPSSLAAVTVDRVPAGVDPSASRGSEMTRVEARRRGCC